MMSEMIERVAKVLSEREGSGPWVGGIMGEPGREMWRKTARAAIEAMREPTDDMLQEAMCYTNTWFVQEVAADSYTLTQFHHAMIDAALASPSIETQK